MFCCAVLRATPERSAPPTATPKTFAGNLWDAKIDGVTIQKLMGHASQNQTAKYDRRPEATRRQAVKVLHVPYKTKEACDMTRRYTRGERSTNRERIKIPVDFVGNNAARQRARKAMVRLEIIKHYGGKCACCSEDRIEFLCIDHPHGGGTKERRDNNLRGPAFYLHLRRQGFPEGHRV
jgi:hypothetical protein